MRSLNSTNHTFKAFPELPHINRFHMVWGVAFMGIPELWGMAKINAKNQREDLEGLQVFIVDNDQPTTCPTCGARTDFHEVSSWKQIHKCLDCKFKFIGESEER